MSIADWILVSAIAGYCLWLIFRPRKKHSCCGCSSCEHCTGCK